MPEDEPDLERPSGDGSVEARYQVVQCHRQLEPAKLLQCLTPAPIGYGVVSTLTEVIKTLKRLKSAGVCNPYSIGFDPDVARMLPITRPDTTAPQ